MVSEAFSEQMIRKMKPQLIQHRENPSPPGHPLISFFLTSKKSSVDEQGMMNPREINCENTG